MTANLQILISGISLGCVLALLALGFVVVAKSTGVFNLTQGGFVVLGGYLSYTAHQTWGLPFVLAVLLSIVLVAALAVFLEATIVHRIATTNLFTPILVTFGLLIIIPPVAAGIWGPDQKNLGDPWGLKVLRVGDLTITHRDLAVIISTFVLLAAFGAFFRFSRMGLAMQATALDPEAALAQGVSDRTVHRLSWGIAGALGAFGGTMLATTAGAGLGPGLEQYALLAIPVIILGGLESPLGAVIGGLFVGIVQQFAVVRVPESFGAGFYEVVPYLLMLVVMLVRPEGFFGTKKVRRI
ncbi:branched-chain amino acid ABC transporter permease [Modestobacter versicolor]|uniref:branched-chain amino acid ABC transporter permease n=1 Tax=Modestobacter versicolor TaxID=429133 RepID=UPI0034DF6919